MNHSIDNSFITSNGLEYIDESIWSDEEFEEIQQETPWEIFATELNHWPSIDTHSANF